MPVLEIPSQIVLKNVLCATDFSPASNRAFPYALAIAGHYGSKLHLGHVIPPGAYMFARPPSLDRIFEEMRESTVRQMQAFTRMAEERGVPCQSLVGFGDVIIALGEFIQENDVDLVVLGTSGSSGLRKIVLGSVAEEIIRNSPCPVLTVGPAVAGNDRVELQRIIYATDFSEESLRAAPYAFSLAREHQAHITLLHVAEDFPVHSPVLKAQTLTIRLQNLVPPQADLRHEPDTVVEIGSPAEGILKIAARRAADLIVIGVRGAGAPFGFSHLLGSVTYKVVSEACCPVLTVRGPAQRSAA